jgi:hypothetical protein
MSWLEHLDMLLLLLLQVSSLRGEHERSVFYPRPAPQGSQLHHKLLAAAAGETFMSAKVADTWHLW